jgi:hypothetical protein
LTEISGNRLGSRKARDRAGAGPVRIALKNLPEDKITGRPLTGEKQGQAGRVIQCSQSSMESFFIFL